MHVYVYPASGSDAIQYNGTSFRIGDFHYVADVVGDISTMSSTWYNYRIYGLLQ